MFHLRHAAHDRYPARSVARLTYTTPIVLTQHQEFEKHMGHDALVSIRALTSTDVERTLAWHNDPDLLSHLGGPFRYVSRDAEIEWLSSKAAYSQREINLAICVGEDATHVGNIYLRSIDWIARAAELHIFIGAPTARGMNVGSSAVQLLLQHAFGDLNLNRVALTVLATNERALRMYARLGFQVEGTLREAAVKKGSYVDLVTLALLAREHR